MKFVQVLVVNYDPPNHHEDYVHRVGRTGRAGKKGTAITFIGPDEERYAPDLVKALRESGAPVPAVSPSPSPTPFVYPPCCALPHSSPRVASLSAQGCAVKAVQSQIHSFIW